MSLYAEDLINVCAAEALLLQDVVSNGLNGRPHNFILVFVCIPWRGLRGVAHPFDFELPGVRLQRHFALGACESWNAGKPKGRKIESQKNTNKP